MKTPNEVLISGERHLIIHGQFGNLQSKIKQLESMIKDAEVPKLLPFLLELEGELEYLVKYYPALDGGVKYPNVTAGPATAETNSPKINLSFKMTRIRNALKDMRLLMDAANTVYIHEGTIDCHLKVMLDEAWGKAAEETGVADPDDIPF